MGVDDEQEMEEEEEEEREEEKKKHKQAPPSLFPISVRKGFSGERVKRDEWSEGAVSTLLEAYEAKWVLRNRAKLKGHDWEDVARHVSSRANCTKSPKTSTQCKNKVESMKKRYRSESAATADHASSSWPLYSRLDLLLRGTGPVLSSPPPPPPPAMMAAAMPVLSPVEPSQPPQLSPPPAAPSGPLANAQNSHGSNGIDEKLAKVNSVVHNFSVLGLFFIFNFYLVIKSTVMISSPLIYEKDFIYCLERFLVELGLIYDGVMLWHEYDVFFFLSRKILMIFNF